MKYELAFQWFTIAFGWSSILLFIALAARKIRRFAAMPLNLRWEVYPVPNETKERRRYGGSYMEHIDWARQSRPARRWGELPEMGAEIFLLKRVRKHNPFHLWPWSMALHWGIYLLFLWMGLMTASHWLPQLSWLARGIGAASVILGVSGTVGLIVRRATHRVLRLYTTPVEYFNLAFLAALFGLGLISWIADPRFTQHQAYLVSLLSFQPRPVSPLVLAMFFLMQIFAIYMPFSRIFHFIMKHFTFRGTLWDDAFRRSDTDEDRKLARQLSYKVNWAGPHIRQGKTWLEGMQNTETDQETEP